MEFKFFEIRTHLQGIICCFHIAKSFKITNFDSTSQLYSLPVPFVSPFETQPRCAGLPGHVFGARATVLKFWENEKS